MTTMQVGVFQLPTYVPERDGSHQTVLNRIVEDAVLAEALGFDSFWATEHHFEYFGGMLSAPQLVLAAVAARTQRIRLGISIALLPLHNPLQVAEEWATLDLLSGGRVEFGFGRGFSQWEFHNFGVDMDASRSMTFEALEVILTAWTHERFSHAGRHFRYDDLEVLPRPLQQPHPPIWVAATTTADTFAWAGQHGHNLMIVPFLNNPAVLREKLAIYHVALAAAGHAPGSTQIFANLHSYVAPTRDQAKADAEAALNRYLARAQAYHRRGQALGKPLPPSYADYPSLRENFAGMSWDELVAQGKLIVGSPDDCVRALQRVQADYGVSHFGGTFYFGGLSQQQVHASMRLFAEHVAPALRLSTVSSGRSH
jgi:natural product biosynthesis luciferase-like monooxygenase protein